MAFQPLGTGWSRHLRHGPPPGLWLKDSGKDSTRWLCGLWAAVVRVRGPPTPRGLAGSGVHCVRFTENHSPVAWTPAGRDQEGCPGVPSCPRPACAVTARSVRGPPPLCTRGAAHGQEASACLPCVFVSGFSGLLDFLKNSSQCWCWPVPVFAGSTCPGEGQVCAVKGRCAASWREGLCAHL